MFEWASYVKNKGAVKLHLVLDKSSFLPQYAVITDGKTRDVTARQADEFSPGAMLAHRRPAGFHAHPPTVTSPSRPSL